MAKQRFEALSIGVALLYEAEENRTLAASVQPVRGIETVRRS
jgi:hypothetical protein